MKKYQKNDQIICENVGLKELDDVMLFNQETEDVHVINSTAYEIFEELNVARSVKELTDIFKKRYSITDDTLMDDINEIIQLFWEKHIIVEV